MAKLRKLTPAKIRAIYKSASSAKSLAAAHGVSPHMIYLVRSGRAHGGVTKGLKRVKLHRGRPNGHAKRVTTKADHTNAIHALANMLLDTMLGRLSGKMS